MNDDPRLGLPSASSFDIVVACSGQPNLKRAIPSEPIEPPEEIAEIGNRIHKARETGDTSELNADELATYEAGLQYEKKLLGIWCQENNIVDFKEQAREDRFWLHDPQTGERALSGQLDVHYLAQKMDPPAAHLLIIDWKSGWSWNLAPSNKNWQLRVQAVLANREYNHVKTVRVGFVKPIATSERIDFTDYNADDLRRAEESIYLYLWLSKQPDAARHPGPHCGYCPCKPYCREAAAYALLPSVIARNAQDKFDPAFSLDAEAMVNLMMLPDLALVHSRASMITKIIEAVKARLKTLDEETLKNLGLVRKQGRKLDPIVNTKEAFDFLKSEGVSEEEIWTALSFSKGALTDALRRAMGWGKAPTQGYIEGKLGVFMDRKRAEDSIGTL